MDGNPAYTVNDVRERFLDFITFDGDLNPTPGHRWDDNRDDLQGDSRNVILQWFNSHR